MTEGLKRNIEAMRQTHRLPSFEQVLVTLEDALTEIKRLTKENIDRLLHKGKLEDEIQRLKSSPTGTETDELIARLLAQITDDHERGCMGRNYGCTCGYDEKTEELLDEAAGALHRLSRNQISASHTAIAQAAAIQAQNADASMREADAQMQRADKLDVKCTQFTEALLKAMTLVDELMRENAKLCFFAKEPPSVKLFAAKNNWDKAMHKLLGDNEVTADTTEVKVESDTQPEGEAK